MFEVGDRVISDYFGDGVVTYIYEDVGYPVKVKFEKYVDEEEFTMYGHYYKSKGRGHPKNIKKSETTLESTNYKTTSVAGFGFLLEFDNGICIYHPNQGQPFQVYPKSTNEGLS